MVRSGSLCLHANDRDPLSEADLSSIWAGQRFPPAALQAQDGRRLRVLNPGRPNSGSGPDFRDAVLELDGQQVCGDVELHVRASFFRSHGHNLDHAYDSVALHVVYLADEGAETRLSDGRAAPVASFAPWLLGRAEELQGWLTAPPLWQDPCRSAAARLGDAGVVEVLRRAGAARFEARVARLRSDTAREGEEQALWTWMLDSLGVGGDRQGFRRLALAFPAALARLVFDAARTEGWLSAALLAVAGLGEPPEAVAALLPRPLAPAIVRTGRPLNWPERRLAALAALFGRADGRLAACVMESVGQAGKARQLLAAWQVAGTSGGPSLLGRERAQELLVNVVLPFAAVHEGLREKAEALLAELPAAAAYGRTAFLESNLARADAKRRVSSAVEQQGLLSLAEEWCRQGGCGRCPLS